MHTNPGTGPRKTHITESHQEAFLTLKSLQIDCHEHRDMSVSLNVLTLCTSTFPTKNVSTSLELVNRGICYSLSGQTRECFIWGKQFVFECSIFQTHQNSRFHAEEIYHSLQRKKKRKPERMQKLNSNS